ncbi:MAG: diadenylate cyclase CdaA [Bacteroidales bacterium]|jgi:uncharacterized protein (TIGR00159 family)|nr:diadenylate cyclase CdaA [Bacteroidales bacterium]
MPFQITITDIIDITLVALILFQLYRLIRGTAAFSIFLGVFLIYVSWLVAKTLKMELITALLGQVIGVGAIAIIIVFQQEVRRFLLALGNRYITTSRFPLRKFFSSKKDDPKALRVAEKIVRACESMAAKKTGALIAVGSKGSLDIFSEGGEILNARVSAGLLETIFFKNTPLHDGATLIEGDTIIAARCPLPATDQPSIPSGFGMRHRAAIGMSEHSDAIVIAVSEENGTVTVAVSGQYRYNISINELRNTLLSGKLQEI